MCAAGTPVKNVIAVCFYTARERNKTSKTGQRRWMWVEKGTDGRRSKSLHDAAAAAAAGRIDKCGPSCGLRQQYQTEVELTQSSAANRLHTRSISVNINVSWKKLIFTLTPLLL